MFKELDLRDAGGTYFSDVVAFAWRVADVAFYDVQLAASVAHGNRWGGGWGDAEGTGMGRAARAALARGPAPPPSPLSPTPTPTPH
jgi:hypothetical protein